MKSLISSVNGRRYGRSSRSSPKIPLENLQQSLHLAPPPSVLPQATLASPPPLSTLPPQFPTLPTPTPIVMLQNTSTTPTPLHQSRPPHHSQPLSPLLHLSYPQTATPEKDKKQRIHSLHHNLSHHHAQQYIRPNHHPKEKPTHTQSIHFH